MLRAVSKKSRPARVGHRIPSGKLGQSQIQIRTKASELLRLCQKCVLGRAPAAVARRRSPTGSEELRRPSGRFVMFHSFRDLLRDLRLLSAFATGTDAPRSSKNFITPASDSRRPQTHCSSPPCAPFSAHSFRGRGSEQL